MSSFLREVRVFVAQLPFLDYTFQTYMQMRCCATILFISFAVMPPLYLSAMSLYIICICSVTLYNTTICHAFSFQCTMNYLNGHFVSSMRWEGGLIAYFNLPCHFNFPPTHSRWNSFPPWEKLRKHNAVPNVR